MVTKFFDIIVLGNNQLNSKMFSLDGNPGPINIFKDNYQVQLANYASIQAK